ncbi:opioid binding protein/cell adhesion molecule-like [Sarotherodon galilaeus]
MVMKRGKVDRTEGITLPVGNIADIEDSYKYLGIPQANGDHKEAARKATTTTYLQRVRQVLRIQLNGNNKIQTINTYTLLVIRGFHPKSNTLRLYTKHKEGGPGLVSVRTMVQDDITNIHMN